MNWTVYFWFGPADGRTEAVRDYPAALVQVAVFDPIQVNVSVVEPTNLPLKTRVVHYRRTYVNERFKRVIYEYMGE